MRVFLLSVIPFVVACQASLRPVPTEWRPQAPAPSSAPRLLPLGVTVQGSTIARDGKPLTPPFAAIESADVSVDRGEVVFAARRADNFDIALVSTDGSRVNWVPEDPADEVAPRWAPRGNKVSYIVRNRGGDFVRTVHIPTSAMLTVDFPFASISEIRWDMVGEEFSVTYETPDASPRIETMTYAGERRRIARAPETRLDMSLDPFAASGLMLRPRSLRYDEKLPLIVWIAEGPRSAWDPDRARLLQSVRAACLIAENAGADLWRAIGETPWVDQKRIYVVDSTQHPVRSGEHVLIKADASIPADRYRRRGTVITTHPSVVKSFAAGFIAGELKGTLPLGHR
jgi:hypothetical protein